MEVKEKVVAELEKIVGAEHVSTARADLYIYSQDMTEHEPSWPDFVVMPDNVEEVQEVLRLANREKIAVTPYTAGTSVGGLAIPLKGGIILDLKRMNRLIELNEEDRYIIVEPGFTFGDLRRLFDKQYPHLWYSFPLCPPASSIMSNALLIGFGYEMNSQGTNYDNTNGMEVVLPTGEVVKIGACSVSPYWSNLSPLPDLAGLFAGWQGTTGVVTKIALQLWPRRPFTQMKLLITTGIRPTCTFIRKLGRTRACDQIWGLPFDMSQRSVEEGIWFWPSDEITSGTYDRPPGPDMFVVMLVIEADTEDELKARAALLDTIMNEELKDTQFTEAFVGPFDQSNIPDTGIGARLGGLTWVGTMGPTSQWIAALEKVLPLFDKYRFMRFGGIGPFRSAHYGMLRPILSFNNSDPDEVERARKCMREVLTAVLDAGFVPYKAPYWAVEEMMRRGDPNWVELLIRVKRMLDPNNIMNPGRYGDTRG
jgi:FAD/FMN-containing dehydrogenase